MFPITARQPESLPSRSKRRLAVAALVLGLWSQTQATEPAVNYMLHCMGCHTADGAGEPDRVPSLRNTLVPFAASPAGRRFLVQVPGSAQSKLTDAELAAVLNWMVSTLSAEPRPGLRPFTAAEVAAYRSSPLVAVRAERERLMASLR
jgi:mono/diheme cytochrome c family protein